MRQQLFSIVELCPNQQLWGPLFAIPSAYLLQHPPTQQSMSLIVNCRSNLFLIHIHYTSGGSLAFFWLSLSPSVFISPFFGLFPSTGIIMMCRQQNRWLLYCPKKRYICSSRLVFFSLLTSALSLKGRKDAIRKPREKC